MSLGVIFLSAPFQWRSNKIVYVVEPPLYIFSHLGSSKLLKTLVIGKTDKEQKTDIEQKMVSYDRSVVVQALYS